MASTTSTWLVMYVIIGICISFSLMMIFNSHPIDAVNGQPSSSTMGSYLEYGRQDQSVLPDFSGLTSGEIIERCETMKLRHRVVDVLEPNLSTFEDKRDWIALRCTSYFWGRAQSAQANSNGGSTTPPSSPAAARPKSPPPPTTDTSQTINTPSTQTSGNHDPFFGSHWPATPTPDIIHTLHGTSKQEGGGIPSSKTSVWDLVHERHLEVSDGVCPSSATKCCPKKDPLSVWGNPRNPLLAICTGVTSRGVGAPDRHPGHLALFQKLMPSIVKTYDCDIDYLVVMGFDKGDEFYDSPEGQAEVRDWFIKNLAGPMAESGVDVKFVMVEVVNSQQKPGPVFNSMLREAYEAGADYYYRLNDDSELLLGETNPQVSWPKVFIGALHSFGPPYGVVGPNGGLPRILTHDFVHRTHMEIFNGAYYPTPLVDWYMDDWVSHVYGKSRTIKATKFGVEHHTTHHGQRYKVNRSNEKKLAPLMKSGREQIGAYAEKEKMVSKSVIVNDPMPPPFMDLPCGEWTGLTC